MLTKERILQHPARSFDRPLPDSEELVFVPHDKKGHRNSGNGANEPRSGSE